MALLLNHAPAWKLPASLSLNYIEYKHEAIDIPT
jgi:hypothetical protein